MLQLVLLLIVITCGDSYNNTFYIDVSDVEFNGKIFPAATVNGNLIGPVIHVAQGEKFRLSIIVSSAIRDLSIHFHGFEMRNKQAYDGVVGVTQCAIRPGTNFTYEFVIEERSGTFW